jgi:large subunit ribosomal protein L16
MLQPSKMKFRKEFKGKQGNIRSITFSNSELNFGSIGIKALEPGRMTAAQIEMARKILSKAFKKNGKVFINIFPHKPVTKKPAEVRMGGGKGAVDHYVAIIVPGEILFEIYGIKHSDARPVLESLKYKLSFKIQVVEDNLKEIV